MNGSYKKKTIFISSQIKLLLFLLKYFTFVSVFLYKVYIVDLITSKRNKICIQNRIMLLYKNIS